MVIIAKCTQAKSASLKSMKPLIFNNVAPRSAAARWLLTSGSEHLLSLLHRLMHQPHYIGMLQAVKETQVILYQ